MCGQALASKQLSKPVHVLRKARAMIKGELGVVD